ALGAERLGALGAAGRAFAAEALGAAEPAIAERTVLGIGTLRAGLADANLAGGAVLVMDSAQRRFLALGLTGRGGAALLGKTAAGTVAALAGAFFIGFAIAVDEAELRSRVFQRLALLGRRLARRGGAKARVDGALAV